MKQCDDYQCQEQAKHSKLGRNWCDIHKNEGIPFPPNTPVKFHHKAMELNGFLLDRDSNGYNVSTILLGIVKTDYVSAIKIP